MQIKEFLDLVWSDQGHYCVVSKDQQENVTPIFLNTIDEAVSKANALLKNNLDVYFTCSTWLENTDRKAKNAREQKYFGLTLTVVLMLRSASIKITRLKKMLWLH